MNFFKNLMSIDEEKHSIVVWTFLICLIIGLYQVFNVGDVSENLLTLILTQLGIIFGTNAINTVTKSKIQYDENNPTI